MGGVERWKCNEEGEGIQEKCLEDSFCFEGSAKDSYLRFCIQKSEFVKSASRGDMNTIEDEEEICTGAAKPKLVPVLFPRGKECYCLTSMCNNKIKLPVDFDIKEEY